MCYPYMSIHSSSRSLVLERGVWNPLGLGVGAIEIYSTMYQFVDVGSNAFNLLFAHIKTISVSWK